MFSNFLKRNSQIKNLLIITPFYYPHLGGVEKHVFKTCKVFQKKGFALKVITQKHDSNLVTQEKISDLDIYRFNFPKIKLFGLFVIWITFLQKYFSLFYQADVVHVHDVMIWCLPLRLLFPRKKFVLTIHGWEGIYPIPKKNIWLKNISAKLANKVICVGAYIGKHYGISCDQTIEGAIDQESFSNLSTKKQKFQSVVYLGRLVSDTGLPLLLEAWKKLSAADKKNLKLIFIGDGELRTICKKYGTVLGWLSENKVREQLEKSSACFASGYLSALEGLAAGCTVLVIAHNQLKKDYWQMSKIGDKVQILEDSKQVVETLKLAKQFIKNNNFSQNLSWLKQRSWQKTAQLYLDNYSS